jgi:hypothetical protein
MALLNQHCSAWFFAIIPYSICIDERTAYLSTYGSGKTMKKTQYNDSQSGLPGYESAWQFTWYRQINILSISQSKAHTFTIASRKSYDKSFELFVYIEHVQKRVKVSL